MSGRTEIERTLDRFFAEGPETVADQAIMRTLDAVDRTNQRRGSLAPWRFSFMITLPRLAAAALVAVIVVGGVIYLIGSNSKVGVPAAPSPVASPTTGAVVPSADIGMDTDTTKWTAFTGSRYGYTVSWPNTGAWIHAPATEDWAGQTADVMWASTANAPWVDKFYNQGTQVTMTAVATTIPAGTTETAFIDAYLRPGAGTTNPCVELAKDMRAKFIDGHPGRETTTCGSQAGFVAVGERMYVFSISSPNFVPFLDAYLTTVRLPPVDTRSWTPFASKFYGFTVARPTDWTVKPGTGHWSMAAQADAAEDWLTGPGGSPDFAGYEAKVPAGMTAQSFIAAYVSDAFSNECYVASSGPQSNTTIDGHPATIAFAGCTTQFYAAEATVVIGNRVWFFDLHGPDRSLIVPFLSTIKLDPTKVVD